MSTELNNTDNNTNDTPHFYPKPPVVSVKKSIVLSALTSLVCVSLVLGSYNLYLHTSEQRDVSTLEKDYDHLTSSLMAVKEQMDQERQARLAMGQNFDHLMDSVSRYQDSLSSIQTELVKMRYDMATIQKMPQFEVGRRMEVLSILATDVSVEYARQKLLLGRNFDAAIAQLKQARERLALSDGDHVILLHRLDESLIQLDQLYASYQNAHIVKRLEELSQHMKDVSFKKLIQPADKTGETEKDPQEKSSVGSIGQYFQRSLEQLKASFVIRKGQQVDLTTLTPEGESRLIDHIKTLIQRAKDAYELGDFAWYQHQLETAKGVSSQYFDDSNQKVSAWLRELQALQQEQLGVDETSINTIFDTLKRALVEEREKPASVVPSTSEKVGG
jgi:uncharacterized protein HemX